MQHRTLSSLESRRDSRAGAVTHSPDERVEASASGSWVSVTWAVSGEQPLLRTLR